MTSWLLEKGVSVAGMMADIEAPGGEGSTQIACLQEIVNQ
jgi:hypothetical protein